MPLQRPAPPGYYPCATIVFLESGLEDPAVLAGRPLSLPASNRGDGMWDMDERKSVESAGRARFSESRDSSKD
jgi:hypothetical protein